MRKKIILIPAYEPDYHLLELLEKLKKINLEVIIVDDGSGKEYSQIFNQAKSYGHVISYNRNKGKGAALKTGLNYIKNNYQEFIVITMDCDGQHSLEDAMKIGEYASSHPNELVLGKRLRSKKTPLKSRIGNAITRFTYRLATGLDVYDTQTGLRAFSEQLVPYMLGIEGERFEYELNVLLDCPRNKIKIKEIQIETIYIENNSHSHFNPIKDSFLIYKEIFKFLFSSLISFIVDYLLYSLFILTSNNLIISNVLARFISATLNYNLNKRVVFKNNDKNHRQLLEYILLAVSILLLNTLLLSLFVTILHFNKFISKIIVECLLLLISWLFQKRVIFTKE